MKSSLSRHRPSARAATLCSTLCIAAALCVLDRVDALAGQLAIRQQGGRPFGGTILGDPATSVRSTAITATSSGRFPLNPRRLAMLMVHASGTKTWETTFDGREGFKNVFLRQGYAVYLTDLPRTGRAGQGMQAHELCADTRQ